jgi:hypothetical protein
VVIGECPGLGIHRWEEVMTGAAFVSPAALAHRHQQVDPDATVLTLYTSGTTGFPKGVMHGHNIQRTVIDAGSRMGITPRDVILMYLPLFHVFGLYERLLMFVATGARVDDRRDLADPASHGPDGDAVEAARQVLGTAMAPTADARFPGGGRPRSLDRATGPVARRHVWPHVLGALALALRPPRPSGHDGRRTTARSTERRATRSGPPPWRRRRWGPMGGVTWRPARADQPRRSAVMAPVGRTRHLRHVDDVDTPPPRPRLRALTAALPAGGLVAVTGVGGRGHPVPAVAQASAPPARRTAGGGGIPGV